MSMAIGTIRRWLNMGSPRTMERGREGTVSGGYQPAGGPVRVTCADPSASREALLAPRPAQTVRDIPSLSQFHVRALACDIYLGAGTSLDGLEAGAVADGSGGLRTITMSVISGATVPPMIRSIELVLTESLLRIV
jgi:hypothetical protein